MSEMTRTEKLLNMSTISTMNTIYERNGAERIELKYLRHLFGSCTDIGDHAELSDDSKYKIVSADNFSHISLDTVLRTFAVMLVHEDLIALRMFKSPNSYTVEVK